MAFGRFSEEQYQQVRWAVEQTTRIKERAGRIIEGIRFVFNDPYPKERWGVTFEPSAQGWIAIETPYGNGRGRLEVSAGAKAAVGKFIIEKQFRNSLDQVEWKKVWFIRIDDNGTFAGDDTDQPYPLNGFSPDNSYAEIALSILYAIARGTEQ